MLIQIQERSKFFVISELLCSKKGHILLGRGTIKSAVIQE